MLADGFSHLSESSDTIPQPAQMTVLDEKREVDAMLLRLKGKLPKNRGARNANVDDDVPPFTVGELREKWRNRARPFWRLNAAIYVALAKDLVERGENFLALEVVEEGLRWFPDHPDLTYAGALASARGGAMDSAERFLKNLDESRAENISLRARVFKDFMRLASDPEVRARHCEEALKRYRSGEQKAEADHDRVEAVSAGINIAALELLSGRPDKAQVQAAKVRAIAEKALSEARMAHNESANPASDASLYWDEATVAECSLIQKQIPRALEEYAAAAGRSGVKLGSILTTYRQARFLMAHHGGNPDALRSCFPLPEIVVFAGHMIDSQRKQERFPAGREPVIAAALAEIVAPWKRAVTFSSAASGADILFLEAMQKQAETGRFIETHIILPFNDADFKEVSVVGHGGANWGQRFEAVLSRATSVTTLPATGAWREPGEFDGLVFGYANDVLLGSAVMRARHFNAVLRALCVWNGLPGEGPGGTADCVRAWRRQGIPITVISPTDGSRREIPESSGPMAPPEEHATGHPEAMVYFVSGRIADASVTAPAGALASIGPEASAHRASAAAEREAFRGRKQALDDFSRVLAAHGTRLVERRLFNDLFLLVFNDIRAAAEAALAVFALRDKQPPLAAVRIDVAVHAGPVLRQANPVNGEAEHIGRHVRKAMDLARLPNGGPLYASQEFAALLSLTPADPARCEYLGLKAIDEDCEPEPLFQLLGR